MPQDQGNGKSFLKGEAEAVAKPSPVPSTSIYTQLAGVGRSYIGSWRPARDAGYPVSIYVFLEETAFCQIFSSIFPLKHPASPGIFRWLPLEGICLPGPARLHRPPCLNSQLAPGL